MASGIVSPSSLKRTSSDPLSRSAKALAKGESSSERAARMDRVSTESPIISTYNAELAHRYAYFGPVKEHEAKRVSDAIDKDIAAAASREASLATCTSKILLLGPSAAGKSTFLRQLRLVYDRDTLQIEREAFRLVILLSIVTSVRVMLDQLKNYKSPSPQLGTTTSTTSPPNTGTGTVGRSNLKPHQPSLLSRQDPNVSRRLRLAPVLSLEDRLRVRLGVVSGTSGVTGQSFLAHSYYAPPPHSSHPGSSASNGEGEEEVLVHVTTPSLSNQTSTASGSGRRNSSRALPLEHPLSDGDGGKGVGDENVEVDEDEMGQRDRIHREHRGDRLDPTDMNELLVLPYVWTQGGSGKGGYDSDKRNRPRLSPKRPTSSSGNRPGNKPEVFTFGDPDWVAPQDDPIHLIINSKEEIESVWAEYAKVCFEGSSAGKEGDESWDILSDHAKHFLSSLDRIANSKYIPTDDDLVSVRLRTIGIEEHWIKMPRKQMLHVCDVAGARGMKHAWAPYFQDCEAIIFVAGVCDYDQYWVKGDRESNKVLEAMKLFGQIASNPLLKTSSLVLFLNKCDLLKKKLKAGRSKVGAQFPEYLEKEGRAPDGQGQGQGQVEKFENVSRFFKRKFKEQIPDVQSRRFYCHLTQANDSRSARLTISSLTDTILANDFKKIGLV